MSAREYQAAGHREARAADQRAGDEDPDLETGDVPEGTVGFAPAAAGAGHDRQPGGMGGGGLFFAGRFYVFVAAVQQHDDVIRVRGCGGNVCLNLRPENRRLASLVQFLDGTQIGGVAERLRPWVGAGRFAWAFDNREDTLTLGRLTGFDVTEFLDHPDLRTPITSYLLYRTEPLIDGTPFALWIDEFWRLLDDAYFESFVRDKLKTIRKKDGIDIDELREITDSFGGTDRKKEVAMRLALEDSVQAAMNEFNAKSEQEKS